MRPVKILIAEDKVVIAETIAGVLEKAGYTISAKVTSGEEAIEEAGKDAPDVVLMDIELSGKMDGIEAAGKIIQVMNVPVIYLTDFGDEATFARAKPPNARGSKASSDSVPCSITRWRRSRCSILKDACSS